MSATHEQWDIVSSVGLTALAVASARALESQRADALITDEYAAEFVKAAQPQQPMPTGLSELDDGVAQIWHLMSGYMGLRTRFLDDFLTDARTRQVVILAAGLDVRAHRLNWPAGCQLWEVDQPKVIEFKQQVLDRNGAQPRCTRHLVPIDLRDDWASAMIEAGFDSGKPTAWLAEGLLPYLPARAEEVLFDRIHKLSATGSTIAVEKPGPRAFEDMRDHPMLRLASERFGVDLSQLWDTEPRRDCAEWLQWAGWQTATTPIPAIAQRYGRELPAELGDLMGHNSMVTATRTS